jgi:hypothetical protein
MPLRDSNEAEQLTGFEREFGWLRRETPVTENLLPPRGQFFRFQTVKLSNCKPIRGRVKVI